MIRLKGSLLDYFNFRKISEALEGSEMKVRKSRIQKRHKRAIEDLEFMIEAWLNKWGK